MGESAAGLRYRQDYFGDAPALASLADLLRDTFGIDVGQQHRFGGPDPSAMPFAYFDADGVCVANFSAFAMPLVVDGRMVNAVGFQSGAVRPEYRGRGLYRDLMRQAFDWSREGFDLGILLTDKPDLYRPHGFEALDQFTFRGAAPSAIAAAGCARRLSIDSAEDTSLLRARLAARMPVSNVFGVQQQSVMFMLNAAFEPSINLDYLPRLETIVAWRADPSGVLHLIDIVAADIPKLSDLLTELGPQAHEVVTHFPPDKLGWDFERIEPANWTCDLMLWSIGDFRRPQGPIALSPMAEF